MAARTVGDVVSLLRYQTLYAIPAYKYCDATNGAEIDVSGINDDRLLFVFDNKDASNDETITIEGGNHGTGTGKDLELTLTKGTTYYIVLETLRFKNTTGANAGKIIFAGTADVGVQAIRLP